MKTKLRKATAGRIWFTIFLLLIMSYCIYLMITVSQISFGGARWV